jgi:hypothetical protein
MGMDIYGKNPTAQVGNYFGRGIGGWAPLWDYCCSVSSLASQVKNGYTNDGDGLDAAKASSLAKTLEDELESGRTSEYIAHLEAMQAEREKIVSELPDEPCHVCKGTGKVRPSETPYSLDERNVRDFAVFLKHCGGFTIF